MNSFVNPYLNPYLPNPMPPSPLPQQENILPPQQILQANGKASIDALKMSPNSSCLIADSTEPIVWKCVSDSLGNVTSIPFDISEHKSEEEKLQSSLMQTIENLNSRLTKLEENYEKSYTKSLSSESKTNKANVGNVAGNEKPTGNVKSNDTKQSAVQADK